MGRKGISRILSRLFILLCLCVLGYSLWKLWGYVQSYREAEEEYEKLRDCVDYADGSGEDTEETAENAAESACPVTVDFARLKEINPDVVGWICIPDTGIDYPVVQGTDNERYLHRTFEGKENSSGCIFMDCACKADFSSDNTILYGHNMKDGEMFGRLKRCYDTAYREDADYREHPELWIVTPKESVRFRIYAAREIDTETDGDVYQTELGEAADIAAYAEEQKGKSLYATETETDGGRLLTLSTCTSVTENGRFVVQAAEVK